ncbi:hypothetical protein ACQKP0_01675 [Heyndrickxia sp. NPDC080065]|uniref:hypothetical protein n=1 Tax=Heyndrickxia sp. NPDC080065 TaxID=3390568 RepID=UPI003D07E533
MSKHYDNQWKLLQHLKPTIEEKEVTRSRIWKSMQDSPESSASNTPFFLWKSILATCLFFFICGGFWLFFQQESKVQHSGNESTIEFTQFSWKLSDVYSKKSEGGLALFQINKSMQVGSVNEVTEKEMNEIINSLPMFVEEKLEHFPYPTSMYIEHVKMMDVVIRYHFFITLPEGKYLHFTFDYPKLEYADIFTAISTLRIKGMEPYIYHNQLYVTHGYGKMIFPVGIQPISISSNKEVYHWENVSSELYNSYLEKITEGLGNWKKKSTKNGSDTFVSRDGNEVVTITREGKTITYEFFYPYRDE